MKFGNLYAIPSRNGLTKPRSVRGDGIKFVNMGELFENERIGNIEMDRVPVSKTEMRDALLQKDDLLFARQSLVREGAGKCSIITEVKEPTTFDSHLIRVRLNRSIANPSFYRYYFASPLSPMPGIVSQCAQAGIKGSDLKNLDVDCPPIEVQDEIASILGTYDELIESNRRQIKLLEEAAQRLYKEWFIDLKFPGHETTPIHNGLPEGWEWKHLHEFADVVMGQSPKSEYYNDEHEGLPFHQGVGSYGKRYVIDGTFCTQPTRIAKADSVLFSVRAPVGRLNITKNEIIIGRGLAGVNHHDGKQSFLFYLLKERFFEDDLLGNGAIFSSITKQELLALSFLIPDPVTIDRFEKITSTIDEKIKELDNQGNLLAEARDRLLPKLMSGEIEV